MTGDLSASGSVTEQAAAVSKSGPSESMKKQPPATSKVCKCHLVWIHVGAYMYMYVYYHGIGRDFRQEKLFPIIGDYFCTTFLFSEIFVAFRFYTLLGKHY